MNFDPTPNEKRFFGNFAPKENLFWKRRKQRILALDDVEEGETQAEVECETDEDCDQGCECSEEGECECDGEDSFSQVTASDYSEEQPRDEGGKWTSGEGGSGTGSGGGTHLTEHPGMEHQGEAHTTGGTHLTEHPAPRVYQRVAAATGEPQEMVEVVPLTKELYDKHVRSTTSADPLAPGKQSPEKSTFEKTVGKGFQDAAFVVTPSGTRVFWMLGKKGFTPPGSRAVGGK